MSGYREMHIPAADASAEVVAAAIAVRSTVADRKNRRTYSMEVFWQAVDDLLDAVDRAAEA